MMSFPSFTFCTECMCLHDANHPIWVLYVYYIAKWKENVIMHTYVHTWNLNLGIYAVYWHIGHITNAKI